MKSAKEWIGGAEKYLGESWVQWVEEIQHDARKQGVLDGLEMAEDRILSELVCPDDSCKACKRTQEHYAEIKQLRATNMMEGGK